MFEKPYYSRWYMRMQFLRAVCHAVTHIDALQLAESDSDDAAQDPSTWSPLQDAADTCEVCMLEPRSGVVLVPYGHSRFCSTCSDAV